VIDGGALRATARITAAWCQLGLLALVAALLTGCASVSPTLRSVATERGATDTAAAACMLAHTFDGQWDELEVMRRFCSKREFLDPWIEEAASIKRLVMAQREGKARP
jgi:hypothetical protein